MAQYLYPFSQKEAEKLGDSQMWRLSYAHNVACATFIDEKVKETFDGQHLPTNEIIKEACDRYGLDRVGWVLTNTVCYNAHDNRFRPNIKEWAMQSHKMPVEDSNQDFVLKSHSELVNGLISAYMNHYEKELGIATMKQCLPGSYNDDYRNKLLILKVESLDEEFKKGEYQYFMAESGNGCSSSALGTKVFGYFLADGERCYFNRCEFYGIADPKQYPEWVRNKLDDQDGGQGAALSLDDDGGMTL